MANENDEFQKMLLASFKVQAKEHLSNLASGLIQLEKLPAGEQKKALVEEIFRAAHSLKGAARAVNLTSIEELCHAAENVFAAIKNDKLSISADLYNLLHEVLDAVEEIINSKGVDDEKIDKILLTELIRQLEEETAKQQETAATDQKLQTKTEKKSSPIPKSKTEPDLSLQKVKSLEADTIRLSTQKLDRVFFQVEEFLSLKLTMKQRIADIQKLMNQLTQFRKEQNKIKRPLKILQKTTPTLKSTQQIRSSDPHLNKLLEFISWGDEFIKGFEDGLKAFLKTAQQDENQLNRKVGRLMDDMKEVLMQPFSLTLQPLKKLVRDLSQHQEKMIELEIKGAETEVDRRILEEIYDPLIHILTNCVDHGIEKPKVREEKNKPRTGHIWIGIHQKEGGYIAISIADDGMGIDLEGIYNHAKELGYISKEKEQCSKEELLQNYIFQSGVTTSKTVSSLSGRGLGLPILLEKVEKLGGSVSLDTEKDEGTLVNIVLPMTLASFRGLYVRVGGQQFLVPTSKIIQCFRIDKSAVKTVKNKPVFFWQGETFSLIELRDILGLSDKTEEPEKGSTYQLIILEAVGKKLAFAVDEILDEEEVLVKKLNKPLVRVRNIAGATLKGSGSVVAILNVHDLMLSAIKPGGCTTTETFKKNIQASSEKKSVMVVEDSITARTLLKNIFEMEGYTVKTAVDGLDAFISLKEYPVDLVVSDVDMPRMNGFELTKKIRETEALEHLPVVLVTALSTPEDREKGIDAGANAYIVKSRFDQSDLLNIVRRLV